MFSIDPYFITRHRDGHAPNQSPRLVDITTERYCTTRQSRNRLVDTIQSRSATRCCTWMGTSRELDLPYQQLNFDLGFPLTRQSQNGKDNRQDQRAASSAPTSTGSSDTSILAIAITVPKATNHQQQQQQQQQRWDISAIICPYMCHRSILLLVRVLPAENGSRSGQSSNPHRSDGAPSRSALRRRHVGGGRIHLGPDPGRRLARPAILRRRRSDAPNLHRTYAGAAGALPEPGQDVRCSEHLGAQG